MGCNRLNSWPIIPIIDNYCYYLNNYCYYWETQNCQVDCYLMCKPVQGLTAIRLRHARRHDQINLSNCSNILISDGNIGLLNVVKPTLSHGRTELVSQIVNSFCNCSTFLDPNMVWKTQLSANLSTICNYYNNINNIKNYNNINKQNNHNNSNNSNKVE